CERSGQGKADRLWSGESNGTPSRAWRRANPGGLYRHAGFCQSGAVRRRRAIGDRHAFRHLLTGSDAVVSAYWQDAFCRTHDGRNPGETNQRVTLGTAQKAAPPGAGYYAAGIDAGPGPEGQTANGARLTFSCYKLLDTI